MRTLILLFTIIKIISSQTCGSLKEIYQSSQCCESVAETPIACASTFKPGLKASIESLFASKLNKTWIHEDNHITSHYGITGVINSPTETIEFAVGTNPSTKQLLTVDSMQKFYSSTKLMAHTLLLKYWEQNLVQLDEPLCTYLPVFCTNGTGTAPRQYMVIRPITQQTVLVNGKYVENDISYPVHTILSHVDVDQKAFKNYSYALVPAHRPPSVRDALTHSTGLSYTFWTAFIRLSGLAAAGMYDKNIIYNTLLRQKAATMGRGGMAYPGYYEYLTMITPGLDATSTFDVHASAGVLVNQPGQISEYGMGSDIVGGLVESAYAKKHPSAPLRLEKIMRSEMWEPLGMDNTFYYLDSDRSDFAALQARVSVNLSPRSELNTTSGLWMLNLADLGMTPPTTPIGESAGGGSYSSTKDYSKLVNMILNKGLLPNGDRYMKASTIEYMMIPQQDILTASLENRLGRSYAYENQNGPVWGVVSGVYTPATLGPRWHRGPSDDPAYTTRREYGEC